MILTKHFLKKYKKYAEKGLKINPEDPLERLAKEPGKPVNKKNLKRVQKGRSAVVTRTLHGWKYIYTTDGVLITVYPAD